MAKKEEEGKITKLKKHIDRGQDKFKDQFTQFLIVAFSFVSAYAWTDAVEAAFNVYFPDAKDSVLPRFIYAIVITTILVLVVVVVIFAFGNDDKKKKK